MERSRIHYLAAVEVLGTALDEAAVHTPDVAVSPTLDDALVKSAGNIAILTVAARERFGVDFGIGIDGDPLPNAFGRRVGGRFPTNTRSIMLFTRKLTPDGDNAGFRVKVFNSGRRGYQG